MFNWPKVYIPHCDGPFSNDLGNIPFSKIFLTVLFDTLTNNVSILFSFLHKHLFKLCIYVIVIVLLLVYMWDFNSFMYVFSYG